MASGLFELKAELTRKEEQAASRTKNEVADHSKGNKTFSKINAFTSKKRKKRDTLPEKSLLNHSNNDTEEIDAETAALYEKVKTKLEAKTKLYNKLHSGEMEDVENMYNETKFLVDFHQKYEEDHRDDESRQEDFARLQGAASIFEADEQNRERLRKKWEKEQEELLDGPVHYENVKFDEVRELGTGYFAFSKNEEERQKQMCELEKLRDETKSIHVKKEMLTNKRKAALQKRLEKVKQRKLGVNSLTADENIETILSETEHENTIHSNEDKETSEETLLNETDDIIKQCRRESSQSVREWDVGKGKGKVAAVKQAFVSSSQNRKGQTYEEIIEKRRDERDQDYAPPTFY